MKTFSPQKVLLSLILPITSTFCSVHASMQTENQIICSNPILNEFTDSLNKAEDLFQWKLIHDAIPYYQKSLELATNVQNLTDPSTIQIRLAEAFFQIGDYTRALKSLENNESKGDIFSVQANSDKWKTLLKSIIFRRLKKNNQAISSLQKFLIERNTRDSAILLQLGISYFANADLEKSKEVLDEINFEKADNNTLTLAKIYQAKIAHRKKEPRFADKILSAIDAHITSDHPLLPEFSYLKGITAYQLEQFDKAIPFLETIIVNSHCWKDCQVQNVLMLLSDCYIKQYTQYAESKNSVIDQLNHTSKLLEELQKANPNEFNTLLLAKLNLMIFKSLGDINAQKKCLSLLENNLLFQTNDSQIEALLLKAQAVDDYLERESYLREITSDRNTNPPLYAFGWLLRGLNAEDLVSHQKKQNKLEDLKTNSEHTVDYYSKAFDLLNDQGSELANKALSLFIETCYKTNDIQNLNRAYNKLTKLIESKATVIAQQENGYLYLASLLAVSINTLTPHPQLLEQAKNYLFQAINTHAESKDIDKTLLLLGKIHFLTKNNTQAVKVLELIPKDYPSSSVASEALYWCGRAYEIIDSNRNHAQEYYQRLYEKYPNSPLAAEANFRMYSYQDYLQGDRYAIKHLQNFQNLFPKSPFTLNALFLIGIDAKRDRKSSDGKWLSKKSLSKSICAFQELETLYEELTISPTLTEEQKQHYEGLYHRSTLERALTNMAIADQSMGAKREIYLEYAESVFKSLISKLEAKENTQVYSDILEESSFYLGKTYFNAKNFAQAEALFLKMIDSYRSAKVTRGYYLSKAWSELAAIEMSRNHFLLALELFNNAEETSKGRILNTEERLSQWIAISKCHQELENYDQAMRMLSRVINEDAVSGLRIKAMLLRSEVYSLQGRYELAKLQLEAASKKGGEWAKKAKEKLEKEYGYQ
ncbi:MAG: tetratricopeptide repeat protein [Chlamydiota bacterium]|nr:tetratricopeptide repeat protein [Chlamydiota bacterium]